MWLLFFLLFSNVRADENENERERPACMKPITMRKCRSIPDWKPTDCGVGVTPDCVELTNDEKGFTVSCPSCLPKHENKGPACAEMDAIKKCKMMTDWKPDNCEDGVTPECVRQTNAEKGLTLSCVSCFPKKDDIPPAKQCFVKGMVEKCKKMKVDLKFCEDEQRPTCEKKEVTWEGNSEKAGGVFNISCPSCVRKIPHGRRCFVDGMLEKCKKMKVELKWCKDERPTCETKEITWEGNSEKPGQIFNISCPSCVPRDNIPPAKRCFIEGMVEKCKFMKVELKFCKDERPTCEKKEVEWEGNSEKPGKIFNMSCPSCVPMDFIPHLCKEKQNKKCEDDARPKLEWKKTKSSICPSCFEVPKEDQCGAEKRKSCAKSLRTLDKCVDREVPTKKDCCFSCVPAKLPKDAQKKKEMVEKCMKTLKNLPECEKESEGEEDTREKSKKVGSRDSNGCRSCAPSTPRREVGKKCTIKDFRVCKEKTPSCDVEEEPLIDEANMRCCPPCVRAASKAHLLRVIACRKLLPECDDDDRSKRNTFLPGEACPICEPKRPKCASECGSKSVCIRYRRQGEEGKECVKRRKIKMILTLKKNVTKAIRDIEKETMTRVLKEFVSRFCERNSESERCAKLKDRVLDSLECTKKRNRGAEDQVEIEVELAEGEHQVESGRRLADTDAAEQFLNDAAKDDPDYIASAELDASFEPDDNSASSPNIFFISVFLSILAFFQF